MKVIKRTFEILKDLHQNYYFHLFWHDRSNYFARAGVELMVVVLSTSIEVLDLVIILAYLDINMGKEGDTLCTKLCVISVAYVALVGYVVYRLIRPSYVLRIAKMRRYNTRRYKHIYWLYAPFVTVASVYLFGYLPLRLEAKLLFNADLPIFIII